MLQRLITAFRTLLARRTIAAIAGEIQTKIDKLSAAEQAVLNHIGLKDEVLNLARKALIELEEKGKAEAAVLFAEIEKSKLLRTKLAA